MKLQKTTMKRASCFLNSRGRQRCVSRKTKSIHHERKLSAFHTVIGATFNILYINPDTAEKCRAYWYLDILFAAFENEAVLPAAPLHLCSFVWTNEKSTWNWWKCFVQAVCSKLRSMQMGCQDCPWMTEWWNIVLNVLKKKNRGDTLERASVLIMWDTEQNELNESVLSVSGGWIARTSVPKSHSSILPNLQWKPISTDLRTHYPTECFLLWQKQEVNDASGPYKPQKKIKKNRKRPQATLKLTGDIFTLKEEQKTKIFK